VEAVAGEELMGKTKQNKTKQKNNQKNQAGCFIYSTMN